LPNQLDDGRADRDKDDRRQNKQYEGRDHLDGCFSGLFFGPLPAFRAEGVGMHPEGLGDAGAEAVGLNQSTNKRADVVNARAIYQISESFCTRLSGTHLQIDQVKLIAEIRMGMMQVLADAQHGLIKSEAGLYADDGQVQGVSQPDTDALLPVPDHALEKKPGDKESETRDSGEEHHVVEAGKQNYSRKSDESQQKSRAEIIVDVTSFAETRLNEPSPGAGNIRWGERNGSAERVESLFEALTQGRFFLDLLLLLASKRAQAGAQDGTGSYHGGAEGKYDDHDGQKHDDS